MDWEGQAGDGKKLLLYIRTLPSHQYNVIGVLEKNKNRYILYSELGEITGKSRFLQCGHDKKASAYIHSSAVHSVIMLSGSTTQTKLLFLEVMHVCR